MSYEAESKYFYENATNRPEPVYPMRPAARSGLSYRSHLKRLLDIVFVLFISVVALPIVGILALLVALDGHSPFFVQPRVGMNNRRFNLLKLRTMVPNSDAILEKHLAADPELRAEWDAKQKLKDDVRITPLGRILRKTSLDELPQLWNVLNGTMSLVGPRPMMMDQRKIYPGQSYYRLRPGITGFWQISDRNDCDFSDRAFFDDLYDGSVSLVTDIKVLFKTVSVVLRGTGC